MAICSPVQNRPFWLSILQNDCIVSFEIGGFVLLPWLTWNGNEKCSMPTLNKSSLRNHEIEGYTDLLYTEIFTWIKPQYSWFAILYIQSSQPMLTDKILFHKQKRIIILQLQHQFANSVPFEVFTKIQNLAHFGRRHFPCRWMNWELIHFFDLLQVQKGRNLK